MGRFSFVSAFCFREKRVNGRLVVSYSLHHFLHVQTAYSHADYADPRRERQVRHGGKICGLYFGCVDLRDLRETLGFYWALLREELTIRLIYHMFNGRSRGNFVQTKIEPSLLELYWVQPKFKEIKCLASECKAKLAWTLLNAARHSKNLNFVQTKIEPSLLELYWVQPKFKEFKCLASESRVKLAWTMPSAAEILQRKSYLRRKLRYNNRKRHTLNELNYLLGF